MVTTLKRNHFLYLLSKLKVFTEVFIKIETKRRICLKKLEAVVAQDVDVKKNY